MLKAMGAKVYVCPAHVSADDSRSYYQVAKRLHEEIKGSFYICLLYTSPSPRDRQKSRMPSSA